MSSLRRRKGFVNIIQELDAFPKVDEDHQETTAAGGGFSLAVFLLIGILVVSEIYHYVEGGIQYKYDIDPDFDRKLKLNIDIMVAMKCSHVGADILDQTGENANAFGSLEEESANFDLPPSQAEQFSNLRRLNTHLRMQYHSLHEMLWKQSGSADAFSNKKESKKKTHNVLSLVDMFPFVFEQIGVANEESGCRFRGTLEVNKVAGNFHITAGKPVHMGSSHVHLNFVGDNEYNFSHRIFHLSFGDKNLAIVNPLDGEEKIIHESNHIFQYFVQVVPTIVENTFSAQETYQYAATEQNRTISHSKGSHGLPGIFIKYDLSPLRVTVKERSTSLVQLLIRLCGIIGGIFATSGLIHQIVSGSFNLVFCQSSNESARQHLLPQARGSSSASKEMSLLSLTEAEKVQPQNPSLTLSLSKDDPVEKVSFRDL